MQELIEKIGIVRSKINNLPDIEDVDYIDLDVEYAKIKTLQNELMELKNEYEIESFLEFGAMGKEPENL